MLVSVKSADPFRGRRSFCCQRPSSPLLPGGAPRKNFRRDRRTGRAVGSGVAVGRGHDQKGKFAGLRAAGQAKFFQCALGRLPAPSPYRAESGHRLCRRLCLSPLRRCEHSSPIKRPEQVKKAAVVPSLRPDKHSLPRKGPAGETCPQPLPNGAFSRTCLHLVMAETLCFKKGSPAQTSRQRLEKRAAAPLSPKIARKQRLEKEATRSCPASAPRNELLPSQVPFPPASLAGAVQQAISVFAPSPPPGGHSPSAGKKGSSSLPSPGGNQPTKICQNLRFPKEDEKPPPHLPLISLSFTTLYIIFTETLVIRQSIHFFFLLYKYVNVV